MRISLQSAVEQDLPDILGLQQRAFYDQAVLYNDFTLPAFCQTLEELKAEFGCLSIYKVEQQGRIIASVRCHVRERTLQVEKLVVEPELQNQGIGTRMLAALERRYAGAVERYQLLTGDKSTRNLHLYRKLGYQEFGRKPLNDRCTLVLLEKSQAGSVGKEP